MNFLKIFSKKNKESDEVYAGLFLKESEGAVHFIHVNEGGYHILAKKKFAYSNGWDNIVEDIDQAMYSLETHTKHAPQKAIFFIYSHLIDQKIKEIKSPFREKIKLLVKNLDFSPLGYIEYHEAIVEALMKKEAMPLTATLIEFDKTNLDIIIYKAGKLVYEETVQRTENLIEDLIPVFEKARIQVVIPSRIILYDSSDLDIEAGRITTYSWKENLFVQLPKVQVMNDVELTDALIKIFLSQISPQGEALQEHEIFSEKEVQSKKEVMGFVIGGDIIPQETPKEVKNSSSKKQTLPFVWLAKLNIIKNNIRIPMLFKKSNNIWYGVIFVIIVVLFVFEYFFHTAQIIAYFPSEMIRKKIIIDDFDLKIATQTATFEDQKETTGKKEIGEYAKGTVTIYNSSLSESKNFAKGTILTGPNNLKFNLDGDVKVASASGDASSVTSSTAKVQITAKEIGSESNLSSGSKLTVSDQSASVVIAKNDSALTGGSKRQVKTASKKDREDLISSVISKAKTYLTKEITPKLNKDTSLIFELTQYNPTNSDYSHELGEETDTISLKSPVEITYYAYKKNDLKNQIKEIIEKNKKNDFEVKSDNVTYKIDKAEKKANGYTITINSTVKLTQDVSEEKIKKQLSGKLANSLEKTLVNDYKAKKVEIDIHTFIPLLTNITPFFRKNISFKISYL